MLREILDLLVERSLQDQAFFVLLVLIVLLVLAAVAFAVFTVALRYRNTQRERRWIRLEEKWESVLLDVLAGDAPPETLLDRVRGEDRRYFVDFLLRYARHLKGQELETVRTLAAPYLDLSLTEVETPNPGRRAWAIQTLATLGPRRYRSTLVEALDDPSPVVAMVAARSMTEERGPDSAREILGRLHRYVLWSRSFLAEMLSSLGADVAPDLAAVYRDPDERPGVRAICGEALMQIGLPGSADMAVDVLESTDLEAVAEEAEDTAEVTHFGDERELVITSLRILEELGRPEHLPLVRELTESMDPVLRSLAVSVLGRAGEPDEDGPRVISALHDPSPWVALHAARSLRELGLTGELERLAHSDSVRADLAREVLSA